jgi:phosphoribosylamine--glycine ligase
MLTAEGPKVLEYNVRFGDPETQAVLPRLKNDLLDVLEAACDSRMDGVSLAWDPRACVCVVMSSGGYPGPYEKGKGISGLEAAGAMKDVIVFHAGTKMDGGRVVTFGGRVLGVTALGHGVAEAIRKAYEAVEEIAFDRCFFRRDIGARALHRVAHAPGK